MSNELISIRAWIEKHSFDQGDSFSFLVGRTFDGVTVKSVNTKVSEAVLDSYINDVRTSQKRKPPNNGIKKIKILADKLQDTFLKTKNVVLKKQIAAKQAVTNSEHKLISTTDYTPEQIKNNSPSRSIKYCIKCNEELEIDAQFCSECGIEQKLKEADESNFEKYNNAKMDIETHKDELPEEIQEITEQKELKQKNDNIKDKFFEAAKQSKICSDGYILMNEFALILKKLGVEWKGSFKNFLENHKDIIEFKADALHYAPAIKIIFPIPKIKIIPPIPRIPEKFEFLEQKLKDADKIYIDTCSLMEAPIEKFFEEANLILKKYNKKIIVPLAVDLELRRITKSKKYEPDVQIRAKNALEVLYPEINEIEIIGSDIDDEGMADPVFKSIFEGHRRKNKMLLISRDFNLSKEILEMNNSKSVHGKKCEVCRIDKDGYLEPFGNIIT